MRLKKHLTKTTKINKKEATKNCKSPISPKSPKKEVKKGVVDNLWITCVIFKRLKSAEKSLKTVKNNF